MVIDLKVNSAKNKTGKQEVQGLFVQKKGEEFLFHFNTARDPLPEENELLKTFRNLVVLEVERLNYSLQHIDE